MENPYIRLDVPRLLVKLGIKAKAKNGGKKYEAPCPNPNHNDKSPSWFIRNIPGEQWHACHVCHGCGWRGGPNSLVESVLALPSDEVRKYLLDLSAPPPMPSRIEVEFTGQQLKKQFKLPTCFKFDDIENWPEKHRRYALSRLHPEQIKRWGIGYVDKCRCPKHIHRNRIALPVRDEKGQPCSYTARRIDSGLPRYAEPRPEENASRCLYGPENWKGSDTVIVTEGIFDALAVESVYNSNVCALRGSNPHPIDLVKLTRFATVVTIVDPDKAGDKARDAIIASCGRHSKVKVIRLPQTFDPSKICETDEGREYLRNRIEMCLND